MQHWMHWIFDSYLLLSFWGTVVFRYKHVQFKEVSLFPKWKNRLNNVLFKEDFWFKEDFCCSQRLKSKIYCIDNQSFFFIKRVLLVLLCILRQGLLLRHGRSTQPKTKLVVGLNFWKSLYSKNLQHTLKVTLDNNFGDPDIPVCG